MKVNRCMKCMRETDRYPCPHCGYTGSPQPDYALRQGTILNGKYLIGCVLGCGAVVGNNFEHLTGNELGTVVT